VGPRAGLDTEARGKMVGFGWVDQNIAKSLQNEKNMDKYACPSRFRPTIPAGLFIVYYLTTLSVA
jgi:hypothetical protein